MSIYNTSSVWKKTIDKKSYAEIFNDKLLTYSISNVTYRRNSNTIYTKEEVVVI